MKGVEIDFETRSAVELRKHGVYVYMASETTEPLMASYRINGGPVQRWRPPASCPGDLKQAIEAGATISAHNAGFERLLMQRVLAIRYGWPMPRTEQFRCTAATAAALALPRKLEHLGAALNLDVQKDKEGSRLIQKFSKPRKARKDEPDGLYWHEPEDNSPDFERFHDYCDVDVLTEAEADDRMIPLSDYEQSVYTMYEKINDRGIRIDIRSARAALRIAEKAKKELDREIRQVTGGYVGAVSQPGKLVEWCVAQGIVMNSAQKAEIESLLESDDLPAHVRRAIEIRQEGAKSSVSKLQAMIDRAGADGRVRGTGIYHAASTGRRQSVGINASNLPRPRREYEEAHPNTEILFQTIRQEDSDLLRAMYGERLGRPLHLLSDSIRGFIWAAPGHDLIQADYSGIEGAVIAWSSNEEWKLKEMFEIIADPTRPDLYRQTAAGIMNTTTDVITKKHPLRQSVGKVSELALGFGGGVSAFHSMSLNYGVKLDPLFAPVWEVADEERREKALKRHAAAVKRGKEKADVLSRNAWIACELIKVGWRKTNPAIAKGWSLREDAVRDAIRNPGTVFTALKFSYVVKLGYLWCRLPSGRCLAYASPKLRDQVWAKIKLDDGSWSDAEVMDRVEAEKLAMAGLVEIQGATSPAITALGVGKDGKMRREHLYGGILAENDTQAIARDILVNGEMNAEAENYPIINDVYDEIIAEVPRGFGSVEEFERVICRLPGWADGLPLTAGGWRGKRYRKD
jgi:DNA polymerase